MQEQTNTLIYHDEEVELTFSKYENGGNTAILLLDSNKEIQSVATTNVPFELEAEYVAIKDYSENTGMVQFLIDNNIIHKEVIISVPSGQVIIPVFKLSHDAICKLNEFTKGEC